MRRTRRYTMSTYGYRTAESCFRIPISNFMLMLMHMGIVQRDEASIVHNFDPRELTFGRVLFRELDAREYAY